MYERLHGRQAEYRSFDNAPDWLRSDVPLPPMLQCSQLIGSIENVVLWLNSGGQRSRLHYDGGNFLLAQLDGRKHFLLVDPAESHFLYSDFPRSPNDMMAGVDSNHVDTLMFPKTAEATLYETTLYPGNIIPFPSMWWHLVTSLNRDDGGGRSRNSALTIKSNVVKTSRTMRLLSWDIQREMERTRKRARLLTRAFRCGTVSENSREFMRSLSLGHIVMGSLDTALLQSDKAIREDPLGRFYSMAQTIIDRGGGSGAASSRGQVDESEEGWKPTNFFLSVSGEASSVRTADREQWWRLDLAGRESPGSFLSKRSGVLNFLI